MIQTNDKEFFLAHLRVSDFLFFLQLSCRHMSPDVEFESGVAPVMRYGQTISWKQPGPLQFVHLHALRKVGPVILSWQT